MIFIKDCKWEDKHLNLMVSTEGIEGHTESTCPEVWLFGLESRGKAIESGDHAVLLAV